MIIEILRSTLNRQYINLSIKTKANFAKYLVGMHSITVDNAHQMDESIISLVHPILMFNVRNANSELKRLNELLFRQLVSTHGPTLHALFDIQTIEQIQLVSGCDLTIIPSKQEVIN